MKPIKPDKSLRRDWRSAYTLWGIRTSLLFLLSASVYGQVQEKFQFAIPALPLKEAILEFSISRDLDVVFVTELTEGLNANPLQGQYTLTGALKTLFYGTGLRARITTDRSITIERIPTQPARPRRSVPHTPSKPQPLTPDKPPNETEEVVVVAKLVSPYRLRVTSSSTKTQRSFLQTPQLVNGVSARAINDAAFRDYTDISQLASSVDFLEASSGVTNELRLRGFAYPSLKLNGYTSHAYNRPPDLAFVDSIEVAKGPSSVLYGRMEPGGIVNMLLKRPLFEPAHSLRLRASDRHYGKLVLDSNQVLRDDLFLRVILLEQQEGGRDRLDQNDNRGLSFMLEKGLRGGASMNLSYQLEQQKTARRFGTPANPVSEQIQLASLDGRILLLDAIQNDLQTTIDLDTHSLQWSFENLEVSGWNVNLQLQYDRYKSASIIAYPFVNEDAIADVNQALSDVEALADAGDNDALNAAIEDLEQASLALDIREEDIELEDVAINNDARFFSGEATAVKQFDWHGFEVEQLYGVNLIHGEPQRLVLQNHDTRGTINRDESILAINDGDTPIDVTEQNLALFAQWIMTLNERTTLFTGGRYDYIDLQSESAVVPFDRTLSEFTWRAGIVFETSANGSVYANYSEAFTPQFTQAEAFSASGDDDETLDFLLIPEPARSQQWELGYKQEWWDEQLQSSCALYQLIKKGIVARTTEQRNRGVECDIVGQIGNRWQLLLSYNRLDADITRGDSEIIGNRPRVLPDQAFKLWLRYARPWREHSELGVSLGAKRISERFADDGNEVVLDAYTVVNLGTFLRYQDRFEARLNIKNLLDENYDEGAFDNVAFWVNKGRQRTIEFTLDFHF